MMIGRQALERCYRELGLREAPFRATPDVDYFFPSEAHVAALTHLAYGVASGALTMLTGEVGLGKTLLCRYVLKYPPPGVRFAYLLHPDQSYRDLLLSIVGDLTGRYPRRRTISELQRALYQQCLRCARAGERVAILVDEAHRLSGTALEGLRLLSNLDLEKAKLLSLLLIGQPELETKIQQPVLRPLNQRISVRYRLRPFSFEETVQYIRHRLSVADRYRSITMGMGAMTVIHWFSRGIPRRINHICDRALLALYAGNRKTLAASLIWRAVREIDGTAP